MNNKIKKGLLAFIMIILLLPFSEQLINYIHSFPAFGAYNNAPDVSFTFEKWWDGSFQVGKNKYINDNTGFRSDMLRMNNQIDYSLFSKAHFYYGRIGPDGCLWDDLYINAYIGSDYIGHDSVFHQLTKLKKVQDTLAALGKTLVLVQAAAKGFFYSEYIPEYFHYKSNCVTNLAVFSRVADSLGINQINFNDWFLKMKDSSKELLYTKQGIHWSLYGATLAEDSFVRYIEKKRGIGMVHYVCDSIQHSIKPQGTDDDMAKPLNLIYSTSGEVFSYPYLRYHGQEQKQRPDAIYIGDSFFCQWLFYNFFTHINNNWQIWFYFHSVCDANHPYGSADVQLVTQKDWMADVKNTDYIVIMYTAKNLPQLGNGFIEQSYNYFYPGKQ